VLTSLRLTVLSLALCAVLYPTVLLASGALFAPEEAGGSLVERDGRVVGSALVGQTFTRDGYLWGRPSAVGYDASATGGSNLAVSNPALRERVRATLAQLDVERAPVDLVLASGSGLDPDVTLEGALAQAPRIAVARGIELAAVRATIEESARAIGPSDARLVRVLELNLRLDERFGRTP
jgi:K+-transporting ATPase ATPase C chain